MGEENGVNRCAFQAHATLVSDDITVPSGRFSVAVSPSSAHTDGPMDQ